MGCGRGAEPVTLRASEAPRPAANPPGRPQRAALPRARCRASGSPEETIYFVSVVAHYSTPTSRLTGFPPRHEDHSTNQAEHKTPPVRRVCSRLADRYGRREGRRREPPAPYILQRQAGSIVRFPLSCFTGGASPFRSRHRTGYWDHGPPDLRQVGIDSTSRRRSIFAKFSRTPRSKDATRDELLISPSNPPPRRRARSSWQLQEAGTDGWSSNRARRLTVVAPMSRRFTASSASTIVTPVARPVFPAGHLPPTASPCWTCTRAGVVGAVCRRPSESVQARGSIKSLGWGYDHWVSFLVAGLPNQRQPWIWPRVAGVLARCRRSQGVPLIRQKSEVQPAQMPTQTPFRRVQSIVSFDWRSLAGASPRAARRDADVGFLVEHEEERYGFHVAVFRASLIVRHRRAASVSSRDHRESVG